ncbi:hypothetical protein BTJ40_08300 [Microbulbifer sp. A4B17]|uniref:hypothetical protein n=1 Tax=Microbulbifer sp. A4B17 TaxID=359370 RepID=UPI000D52AFE1|nr:hypothetical protein [Microbulbifer sp. A4B17]AWF80803.1 hypothetical protein BTJ40_08300 [Microbulbifer sp. A4B17]
MNRVIKRSIAASAMFVTVMNLSACGYFLYPERKGQAGGRVDPAVVILDGAGLLFGLLPGIVAFAVDITNGTIYLPPGHSSVFDRHVSSSDQGAPEQVTDEEGQAWLRIPMEGIDENTQLEVLSDQLSGITGQHVDAEDIVWLQDSAELRAVSRFQAAAR